MKIFTTQPYSITLSSFLLSIETQAERKGFILFPHPSSLLFNVRAETSECTYRLTCAASRQYR